jgi:hypothetical protein
MEIEVRLKIGHDEFPNGSVHRLPPPESDVVRLRNASPAASPAIESDDVVIVPVIRDELENEGRITDPLKGIGSEDRPVEAMACLVPEDVTRGPVEGVMAVADRIQERLDMLRGGEPAQDAQFGWRWVCFGHHDRRDCRME